MGTKPSFSYLFANLIYMGLPALCLIAVVAIEHLYIMYMEMFAWETLGKKTFRGSLADELFRPTKKLAANQGLYNGFLAAGLTWSFFITDPVWQSNIALFFLSCVLVAGVYGGITAHRKIFFTQGLPALLALIAVLVSRYI